MKAKISLPAGVAVFAFLALAGLMGLFALTAAPSAQAQEDSTTIEYAENGADPVVTMTAVDPEGATPIAWFITTDDPDGADGPLENTDNPDAEHFMIDDETGELKFNIAAAEDGASPGSPDYENDQDDDTDNTYTVVVSACDVELDGNTCPGKAGHHKVTVKVTKVDEEGEVTWTVDPDGTNGVGVNNPAEGEKPIMQFQVGALLAVPADGVTDGDMDGTTKTITAADIRWQWHRSPSKTAMGTAIDDETSATYTVTTDDIGMYIRVEAFYNVGTTGREEKASRTSDYPVLGSRSSNDAPEFASTTLTREVSEGKKGMTVGAPVTATDDITNALNYALFDEDGGIDGDSTKFEIDQKTGQITTKVDLNREVVTDENNNCGPNAECVVTVTATDSAGAATGATGNPDSATVTITLTNVDEKPKFDTGFKMRDVMEGMTQVDDDDDSTNNPADEAIYAATDPDGQGLTYRLMGADGAKFQLNNPRFLSFRTAPDYENPTDANRDNVYEVTVRASDGTMYADRMVIVTVMNRPEAPEIMGRGSVNFAENGEDPVATFTATDPEGATTIAWFIAAANTDHDGDDGPLVIADAADATHFTIDDETGELKFDIAEANEGSSPGSPRLRERPGRRGQHQHLQRRGGRLRRGAG